MRSLQININISIKQHIYLSLKDQNMGYSSCWARKNVSAQEILYLHGILSDINDQEPLSLTQTHVRKRSST